MQLSSGSGAVMTGREQCCREMLTKLSLTSERLRQYVKPTTRGQYYIILLHTKWLFVCVRVIGGSMFK